MVFATLGLILTISCFITIHAADTGQHVGCFGRSSHDVIKSRNSVGNCFDFCAKQFYRYSVLFDDKCGCENKLKEREEEKTKCESKCLNNDEELSCGGSSTEDIYETGAQVAGRVRNFKLVEAAEDKISVTWDAPERNGTELTSYEINAVVLDTFSKSPWAMRNRTWKIQKSQRSFDLSSLVPSTTYRVTISSKNNDLNGGESSLEATTKLAKPSPKPDAPKLIDSQTSDGRLKIEITKPTNENGPISSLLVVVQLISGDELTHDFDEKLLKSYQKGFKEDGLSYYISAEINPFPEASKTFEIGNGQYYGQYFNAPLPKKPESIGVLVGVLSRFNNDEQINYSEFSKIEKLIENAASSEESDALVIILTIACILGGLILLGSVLFYGWLRMLRVSPRISRFERHEMSLQGPILEVDNSGFVSENLFDVSGTTFNDKLQEILRLSLDDDQKIPRKNLSLDINDILGIGSFGDVIKGQLNGNIPCQVHACHSDLEPAFQIKFIRELNNLLQFGFHKNLLTFMGICLTHDWIFLTFEDTEMTLKQFLIQHRDDQNLSRTKLTNFSEEQAIRLMLEFSETMSYLVLNKIVHKNLNSHNIRIKLNPNTAPVLQVTIFGPTLYNISEEGVKTLVDDERWFAPEVMRFQKFSHASDVFSMALVMWEIATCGATVYGTIATSDVFARVKKGFRPERSFISEDLYGLLWNCWELEPNERCSVDDLVGQLKHFLQIPHYYLNYSVDGLSHLPYFLPLLEFKN